MGINILIADFEQCCKSYCEHERVRPAGPQKELEMRMGATSQKDLLLQWYHYAVAEQHWLDLCVAYMNSIEYTTNALSCIPLDNEGNQKLVEGLEKIYQQYGKELQAHSAIRRIAREQDIIVPGVISR